MPLKLNVSIAKKIGQPDFGSLGASCSVEVELPHNIVFDDLEAFHRQAKSVYVACAQAVNDELSRHQNTNGTVSESGNGHAPATNGRSNGHQNGNGNGNGHSRPNGRTATVSQVRAIHAIANRQKLDLAQTLQDRFGIDRPDALSISQASELIDELKGCTNGTGGRR